MNCFASPPCGRTTSPAEFERLYEQVQLIVGKGSRRRARLCIMTFVALLAGERHTDAPAAASPLVRQFAIILNDGMPDDQRQRLKPFAPRIIGTRDARDPERGALLHMALREEIVPQLRRDGIDSIGRLRLGLELSGCDTGFAPDSSSLRGGSLDDWCKNHRGAPARIGETVAKLLVRCAAEEVPPASRDWYWSKAIDLLDRLCDRGNVDNGIALDIEQLVRAQRGLGPGVIPGGISQRVTSVIGDLRQRLIHGLSGSGAGPGKPGPALQVGMHLH